MRGESFVHSLHKGGNIQRSNVQLIGTGFDTIKFLQVIHKAIEAVRLGLNLLIGFIGRGQNTIHQAFHRTFDGGKRRAEFMADIANGMEIFTPC